MSWNDKETNQEPEPAPVEDSAKDADDQNSDTDADVVENKAETEETKDTETVDEASDAKESKEGDLSAPEDQLVPQAIVGKLAKKIRDEGRAKVSQRDEEIERLRRENEQLKATGQTEHQQDSWETDLGDDDQLGDKLRIAARREFIANEEAKGRAQHGDQYQDWIDIVKAQSDSALNSKIFWAPDPVKALKVEAERIAEEISYGSDPVEREKKKTEALKEQIRREIQAELTQKLGARNNQPPDIQNVRVAGGDHNADKARETWGSGSKPLPK